MRCNLALLLTCSLAAAATTTTSSVKTPSTSNTASTCPYRTINYVTHGLPQQCLNTSHRSVASDPTANINNGILSETVQTRSNDPSTTVITAVATPHTIENEPSIKIGSKGGHSSEEVLPSAVSEATKSQDVELSDISDESSPLEDGKFLSFEDWKRQNLQKIGQSHHIGKQTSEEQRESRKRSANIHAALDSLGDEGEIDLDFSGLIPDGPDLPVPAQSSQTSQSQTNDLNTQINSPPNLGKRNRDAGTTSKERFNYASFDCAANVLKTNKEARSASTVLGENKDSYMLNECSAQNKFLILELCDDISIDTIVLANFEFFSSSFRTFRVSVSDKYPIKSDKWMTIGFFEARNTRDVQAFLVENPAIWARYVRIEFLTHYGNEFYCPVSLVRVHGTTMMDEYKHDLESLQSEEEDRAGPSEESEVPADDDLVPEAVAQPIIDEQEEKRRQREGTANDMLSASTVLDQSLELPSGSATSLSSSIPVQTKHQSPTMNLDSTSMSTIDILQGTDLPDETCGIDEKPGVPSPSAVILSHSSSSPPTQLSGLYRTTSISTSSLTSSTKILEPMLSISTITPSSQQTSSVVSSKVEIPPVSSSIIKSRSSVTTTQSDRLKSGTATSQTHPAIPTMQESFFKQVQKRLQMLETNSSLSLQYIEDQSRALRDAFNKVEQRQLSKTTTFLSYLNTTVLNELREFRQQYDQLWQSTVIELQIQRERYQQENLATNARLGVLADELIFHKRMAMLQMLLVLICLVLVLFTKGALNTYLEMPLVQSLLARSPSTRWMNLANLDTPSRNSPLTRARSAQQLRTPHSILKGHKRTPSGDSIDMVLNPEDIYTPPTPVSNCDITDDERSKDDDQPEDPSFDPSMIERPSTSPPVLPSMDVPLPELNGIMEGDTIDARLMDSLPPRTDDAPTPDIVIRGASPTPKHLTWNLPDD